MPEGPEVEVVRQALADQVKSLQITQIVRSDKALRRPANAEDFQFLKGKPIREIQRHGKLLYFFVEQSKGFWCRLGMAGKLLLQELNAPLRPHTHVLFHLSNGQRLAYVDPRRFGEVVPFQTTHLLETELQKMGPDPLCWTPQEIKQVSQALHRTKRQIKVALLDQSLLAGVGNIYACEALFRASISPFRQARNLSTQERSVLLHAVENVLKDAVAHGGTTFSDYEKPDGQKGKHFNHRRVFQRMAQPCYECKNPIRLKRQHGRATFYCSACQKTRG